MMTHPCCRSAFSLLYTSLVLKGVQEPDQDVNVREVDKTPIFEQKLILHYFFLLD